MDPAQKLHQSSEDSQEQIRHLEGQLSRLQEENRLLHRQKETMERTLEEIALSKSWRITKPLRALFQLKRAIFPLYSRKQYHLKLQPGRSVTEENGKLLIDGPSPTVQVHSEEGDLPSGWFRIRGKLHTRRNHLFFFLYHHSGEDFQEHRRVWLAFEDGKDCSQIVHFPPLIKGLRLDPFDSQGSFSFEYLEVDQLGIFQVIVEFIKKHFTQVMYNPGMFLKKVKKAIAVFREHGIEGVKAKIFVKDYTADYQEWIQKYDTITDADRNAIRKRIEVFPEKPLVSILMPVYNPPVQYLAAAIESVQRQLYENWELCIADDCSTDPEIKKTLEKYSSEDSRIRIVWRKENGHISRASNSALDIAKGKYVCLLDHDDELREHALYMVLEEFLQNPEATLVYSDEDKINAAGQRFNPYFKSGWNPDLLLSQNYICHLMAMKADIVRQVGGFRSGVEGAQDWDLSLRISDEISPRQIHHIPHVLYHWRVFEGSTAASTLSKPYVMKAQQQAVTDHLNRKNVPFEKVEIQESISQLRVHFPVPEPAPLVSIIIPTRDRAKLLRRCVDGILNNTSYSNIEVLILDNDSVEAETLQYFESLKGETKVQIIREEGKFNFSRLINIGAKHASGEILGLLNNDLEVIHKDWLEEMIAPLMRPGVGVVGSKLYFPNDLVQHAGVVLGIGGVAGHSHKGQRRGDPGYWNRLILMHNVSAVTAACLLVRKSVFEEAGGFDEEDLAVAFNDIDFCLRVQQDGYLISFTPYAELYHHESASRGLENTPQKFLRFESEIDLMKKRWGQVLESDPYYNLNLSLIREDFTYAFPPRSRKPWL